MKDFVLEEVSEAGLTGRRPGVLTLGQDQGILLNIRVEEVFVVDHGFEPVKVDRTSPVLFPKSLKRFGYGSGATPPVSSQRDLLGKAVLHDLFYGFGD